MVKRMDRYSLISTFLPIDIQFKIIIIAEELWYNKLVNIIIQQWYRYMGRKIAIFNISLTLSKYYNKKRQIKIIDTLSNINLKKMKYMYRYFTGKTEDIYYWTTLLKKVCISLTDILLMNKDIWKENSTYREMNYTTFCFINKIKNIDNKIINDPIIYRWLTIMPSIYSNNI